jgi:drug/metabolite transporter (DMT)-like permease
MQTVHKGYLLSFIGVFTWAFSEITVKLLQGAVGPVSLTFLRFSLGSLFLFGILGIQRDFRGLGTFFRRCPGLMLTASLLALGLSNIIYFYGLQLTQANVGSALYTTYPIFISLYSIFILGERSNIPLKLVGFCIGFLGTSILMTNFNFALFFAPGNILGNILLVTAAAIWAFYSVLGKKIMRALPDVSNVECKYSALSFALASLPSLAMVGFTEEAPTFLRYSGLEWGLVAFMGFIVTGLGIYVFFKGVIHIEVSRGISLSLLKPVLVTVFAFFILGELPTAALGVSIPLVALAVLLINRRPPPAVIN